MHTMVAVTASIMGLTHLLWGLAFRTQLTWLCWTLARWSHLGDEDIQHTASNYLVLDSGQESKNL